MNAWTRLPGWAKVALVLAGLVSVAVALRKGGKLLVAKLLAIPGITAGKAPIVGWMLHEWRKSGRLSTDEQAALLAAAYMEGKFKLHAISADGMPDDKAGKAWGTFQFTKRTLEGLGATVRDVTPQRDASGVISHAELERASRGSARLAEKLLFAKWKNTDRRPWLEYWREKHARDPFKLAREIFTYWNAGSVAWAKIEQTAPSRTPGGLGYVHHTVAHKLDALNQFRGAVGLPTVAVTKTV